MKIKMKPTITAAEIYKHLGVDMSEHERCYQRYEDSCYVALDLSDENVERNKKNIKFFSGNPEIARLLSEELKIMEYFRNLGYIDEILIYIP